MVSYIYGPIYDRDRLRTVRRMLPRDGGGGASEFTLGIHTRLVVILVGIIATGVY